MSRATGRAGYWGRMAGLLALIALTTAACQKAQLLAPTGSEVTLTSNAVVLSGSGSTVLTAFVAEESGTPVQNGTTVRFTTSLGRLESSEAQTRNGLATTTLFADGATGVATVRAQSGGVISDEVEITIGAAAIDAIVVTASPAVVSASGGTTTITARVTGANNLPLANLPVSFSTTAGTLSATSATTNSSGDASVTLTTNREATVTAQVGGESDTVDIDIRAAAGVTLGTPTAGPIGGATSVLLTPSTGTAPSVTVDWGDGESDSLGIVATARTLTHVYDAAGTYTITATATDNGDQERTSTSVTIAPFTIATFTASPGTSVATVGNTTTFTATVANGTAASFEWDFGDGTTATTTTPSTTHVYTSNGRKTATVTATTATGATASGRVEFIITSI